MKYRRLVLVAVCCLTLGDRMVNAAEAYVRRDGDRWTLGTAKVERVVALEDGKLLAKSFRNKATGRELIPPGVEAPEFFLSLGEEKQLVTGATGPWTLVSAEQNTLEQGELQFDLTARREALVVTRTYVLYPESSVIRQWLTVANAGEQPLLIFEPGFLAETVRPGDPEQTDFHWMTGADNFLGSWDMTTEKLAVDMPRVFDSNHLFPGKQFGLGHGAWVMALHNGRQIWPEKKGAWIDLPHDKVTETMDVSLDVKPGDTLAFAQKWHWSGSSPTNRTTFVAIIRYEDGEAHSSEKEFSDQQGKNGWRYQYSYLMNGHYEDLEYDPEQKVWKTKDAVPFISARDSQPAGRLAPVRSWTAERAGRVRVTAEACNTGNEYMGPGAIGGRRSGTKTYAPWYALQAGDTGDGMVIGWDYFGHWASTFERQTDGAVVARLRVAGYEKALSPGESMTTPKAFTALFRADLDEAGNELLDWQYRYLWDYTRDGWFPAIRMLGYWMRGTGWGQAGVGWLGGKPDMASTFRKVFRVADLMRYCGGDVYHRDHGWWDRAGDWNGPDFRATGDYLRKYGMGQLIYAFLYTVDPECEFVRETNGRYGRGTLDMACPEVVEHLKAQLDEFYDRWGAFEWRNDSGFLTGSDTNLVALDTGFRKVIRDFLDKHPDCAFQGVNGGGMYAGYDYARYSSTLSFSDGAVGILRNYYASLLLPPDKSSDIPDRYDPDKYDKATWRGLLCINFDMTGDTWDPAKLEGLRELIDIYHYLHKYGVVGRWVKIYRPVITGDDKTMYLQRLSRDRLRGIIIPKRPAPAAVTITPKGLLSDETYFVSFHESEASEKRTGADLMERGIVLEKMLPGELIYLNLPLHPGSRLDKTPPTSPPSVAKTTGENMGYPGVELTWQPGTDDNWVSYYEIFRNGAALDKVAKGAYYFDHSAGADLAATYEIRTVDGAGNTSAKTKAAGPEAAPARIVGDTSADLKYSGEWKHEKDVLPAHEGTLTWSTDKGDAVELAVEGGTVLWFAKLGPDCGKAAVSLDGSTPELVDTYSADHIFGVCVFRKKLPPGPHTLQITVLDEASEHTRPEPGNPPEARVYIDGLRVERETMSH